MEILTVFSEKIAYLHMYVPTYITSPFRSHVLLNVTNDKVPMIPSVLIVKMILWFMYAQI
jgi:hypothetical protein